MKKREYEKKAIEAWGGFAPAWVRNLAATCDLNGIPLTSARIGISETRIRSAINCQDNGCITNVRLAVEKHIMGGRP